METQLFENISELGKLRSESIALQRGEYSTRLAMSNLLVYNMTHGDQVMSVVLNRGAPTSVGGFESNDDFPLVTSTMLDGTLSVGAHSVTVIELMLMLSLCQYMAVQMRQQRTLMHLLLKMTAPVNILLNQSSAVLIALQQILMLRPTKTMAVVV